MYKFEIHSENGIKKAIDLPMNRVMGWCNECNDFSPIEKIPSRSEVIEKIREIQNELKLLENTFFIRKWFSSKYKWAVESKGEELIEFHNWKLFLSIRKSPPKCMTCGSAKANAVNIEEFIHPGCGGKFLTNTDEDGIRLSVTQSPRYHTVEGDKLYQERPTPKIILIVDDDTILTQAILNIIDENISGVFILEASNGKEALEILNSPNSTNLLITNLKMPVIDGEQLVDFVLEKYPSLPIFVISDYAEQLEELRNKGYSSIKDYFLKPFEIESLLKSVSSVLIKD